MKTFEVWGLPGEPIYVEADHAYPADDCLVFYVNDDGGPVRTTIAAFRNWIYFKEALPEEEN